jgi:DNA-directed RNA polymerase specialized sigma24 family protein
MARNKVSDQERRLKGGERHNIERERSLDGSARLAAAGLADSEPGPGEQAEAREQWERMLEGRPDQHRRALELLIQGHTHEEIATAVGLNEKTIRRLIQRIALRASP